MFFCHLCFSTVLQHHLRMDAPDAAEPEAFLPTLCEMLLCLGDWPSPSLDTAAILEPVLARDVSALVVRACNAPNSLNNTASKSSTKSAKDGSLQPEQLVFALRRDALMTSRLMRYLEEMARATQQPRNLISEPLAYGSKRVDLRTKKELVLGGAKIKQLRALLGELNPRLRAPEDEEVAARRLRLDRLTRAMTVAQYEVFSQRRSTPLSCLGRRRVGDLASRGKATPSVNSTSAWLLRCWPAGALQPTPATRQLLLFLLREMAALLLDAALLVRAEQPGQAQREDKLPKESVRPEHVREAVRRLQLARGPGHDTLLIL